MKFEIEKVKISDHFEFMVTLTDKSSWTQTFKTWPEITTYLTKVIGEEKIK